MVNPRLALRTLLRTPFVTAVAVISLALGIGANAAIFSIFNQFLYRRLPVQEPGRLVNLANPGPKPGSQSCGSAGGCDVVFSYQMFRDLQRAEGSPFSSIAAHVGFGANLAYRGNTMSGSGQMVSGSYFQTLGVNPILGRVLTPEDDRTVGAHPVAVISHSYWENNLGADPAVLNDIIVVNGASLTVVGVAPPGFEGTVLGSRPHLYVPLTMRGVMYPGWEQFENRRSYWAYLFARLRPGVGIEQASTAINAIYTPILHEVEAPLQTGMSDQTMRQFLAKEIVIEEGGRGQSNMQASAETPLLLLMVITGIVLLIACANIANLLMARGANRALEMAVRLSLGAGRKQLLGQLLMESTLLAVMGGAMSLLVASSTLGLIGALLPPDAAGFIDFRVDGAVMLSAAVLSLGTGILFGIFPALHSTRPGLINTIRANTGQPAGARAAARFRATLVTAQIALSMTLLITAGLFVKSLVNISQVDLGIETDNVVVFGVSPVQNGYEPERSRILFERLEEELAAQPGVSRVGAARVGLLTGNSWGNDVSVQGFASGPDVDANSRYNAIGPGYFRMLGVPLLAGREFTVADAAGGPSVAIVNETFSNKFGLGRDAVGMRMARNRGQTDLNIEIVGLIPDIAYNNVKQESQPVFYLPYRQEDDIGALSFYARTSLEPEPLLRAVPQIVAGLDANLPVEELKTLPMQVRENVFMDRMISTLSASFAVLATLLAAIGLYGVLAYTVAQRTREIGVRMALGADGRRVRAMVLRQVAWMTLIGGAAGIAAAIALGRLAGSLLFEMQSYDLVVIATAAVILALTAFGAGELPAWRASRVNPTQALRYE